MIQIYSKLIKNLRHDSAPALQNCEFDFVHAWMLEAADAIEELQKDLERSKDFEAFWQHEAEETLKKFQVAISNKPRWIPVTERLPEDGTEVLAFNKTGFAYVDCWTDEKWKINSMVDEEHESVTHWMPLPQPPKEET